MRRAVAPFLSLDLEGPFCKLRVSDKIDGSLGILLFFFFKSWVLSSDEASSKG